MVRDTARHPRAGRQFAPMPTPEAAGHVQDVVLSGRQAREQIAGVVETLGGRMGRVWQAQQARRVVERLQQAASGSRLWHAYRSDFSSSSSKLPRTRAREGFAHDPSGSPDFKPFQHLGLRPDGGLKFLAMAQHGGGWPAWPKFIKVAFGYVVLLVNVSILLRCASVARQDISAHGIWSQPGELSQKVPHERWPRPRRRWPHNDGEANEGVQRKVDFRQVQVGFLPPVWRQAVVSVYEIGGLAYYFMRLLVAAWRACRTHGGQWEDLYNSWEATVYIYWDLIPSVRTFSALRALKHVHPQLFPAELRSAHLKYSMRLRSCRQRFAMISLFVIKRIVILWFGLQAFMHKFTQTAAQLEMNEGRPLTQMFLGIVFLNQLVGGVVQMDIQFRNRLMLFLFGGEDAKVEPEEDALLNVWVAHVANALWQRAFCLNDDAALDPVAISTFKGATPKERRMTALERLLCWIRWVVAISDFNHIDLQKAVLCEGEEHRQRRNEILGSRSIDHNAISFLD
ncbi:unnamed protein product [Prorocentrum cordatum]|uniref:Autophagy-related protein 9 n=1 Tax=Prorocentrum cordatum TaxID=2364126 RepID=A0ABN9WAJ2_9DINO|nr:unnamed protein product [Polarella glacialis]